MNQTNVDPPDDYLYDHSGARDPEVERLERLLRPLGVSDDGAEHVLVPSPSTRGTRRVAAWGLAALAAAAGVLVALRLAATPDASPRPPPVTPVPVATAGPDVRDATANTRLAVGSWVETGDAAREVEIGALGRLTLGAKSRLQVRHIADDTTRLYLARGSLEARVSADAHPRFFQVDTDATRCVDLGCHYTLEVADDGVATVHVTTGRVAFENGAREVLIPAGATCVARPVSGAGTPRFVDAPYEIRAAFDALDAARSGPPELRAGLARSALATVRVLRDTLPAWHLLQDADADVVRAAAERIESVAGPLPEASAVQAKAGGRALRDAWKEYLLATAW